MKSIPLGKKIDFKSKYDPSLLFSIPREEERKKNNINLVFKGYDVWNAYEISWLNKSGKPEVKTARIIYSADSKNIVESKSFKLYLGSFNMTKFENESEVSETIEKDLSKILEVNYLKVLLFDHKQLKTKYNRIPDKLLLDNINISIDLYNVDSSLLKQKLHNGKVIERYSNLLKTNCPITGQPDWATVYIKYKSKSKIKDDSLLKYIISYRECPAFHESSCERIFNDIYKILKPEVLVIKCFYTRRGGIDINPLRYYGEEPDTKFDFCYWRQ